MKSFNLTPEWLKRVYEVDLLSVKSIAEEAGCSVHNIKKRLHDWGIKRGKLAIVGKPSWNAGLTKETSESMKRVSDAKIGENNPMFGKEAWNTGLTKETDERVAGVSKKLTGRHISGETRVKQSKVKKDLRGAETNRFVGERVKTGNYWTVLGDMVNGHSHYEYEHRLIAEKSLGRKLSESEEVHHVNFVGTDNFTGNLLVTSKSGHASLHQAMKKSKSIFWPKDVQIVWLNSNGFDALEIS